MIIPEAAAVRAATRYKIDENGCYISTYSRASHGYAQVGWQIPGTGRNAGTTAHPKKAYWRKKLAA